MNKSLKVNANPCDVQAVIICNFFPTTGIRLPSLQQITPDSSHQSLRKDCMPVLTFVDLDCVKLSAESYRASILKAFSKTVEEGRFPFVILDAPNIQVEDFRPFYMVAQVTNVND